MSVTEDQLAEMVMDDDGAGCAITSTPVLTQEQVNAAYAWADNFMHNHIRPVYRVIYAYGDTEVESIRAHITYGDALAEVAASGDDDCDDAWVEETAY